MANMKIIHFSDLHIWKTVPEMHDLWYPKRLLGFVNLSLRRKFKFPPEYGQRVLAEILKSDADAVVFSGDMTTASTRKEFEETYRMFRPVYEKWGDRFFVLPGNHDRYTPYTMKKKFFERLFPQSVSDTEDRHVLRADINDSWSIAGFDASKPYMIRSNGAFSDQRAHQLENMLKDIEKNGRKYILVGHFPYDSPPGCHEGLQHRLIGADKLIKLIHQYQPAAYLHGHKHVRWNYISGETPDTICINSGSAGMKSSDPYRQAGFLSIELGDSGIDNVYAHVLSPDASNFEVFPLES